MIKRASDVRNLRTIEQLSFGKVCEDLSRDDLEERNCQYVGNGHVLLASKYASENEVETHTGVIDVLTGEANIELLNVISHLMDVKKRTDDGRFLKTMAKLNLSMHGDLELNSSRQRWVFAGQKFTQNFLALKFPDEDEMVLGSPIDLPCGVRLMANDILLTGRDSAAQFIESNVVNHRTWRIDGDRLVKRKDKDYETSYETSNDIDPFSPQIGDQRFSKKLVYPVLRGTTPYGEKWIYPTHELPEMPDLATASDDGRRAYFFNSQSWEGFVIGTDRRDVFGTPIPEVLERFQCDDFARSGAELQSLFCYDGDLFTITRDGILLVSDACK